MGMQSGALSGVEIFHTVRKAGELFWISQSSSPIREGSTLMIKHLPKTSPPHTITLGFKISTCGF